MLAHHLVDGVEDLLDDTKGLVQLLFADHERWRKPDDVVVRLLCQQAVILEAVHTTHNTRRTRNARQRLVRQTQEVSGTAGRCPSRRA